MKLIYFTLEDVSVYESQILELLKYMQNYIEVVLVQGYKNSKEKDSLIRKLSNYKSIRYVWYKTYPLYQLFQYQTILNAKEALLKEITDDSVIHVRGQVAGSFYKMMMRKYGLKTPAIIDVRGYPMEIDFVLKNAKTMKRKYLSVLHRRYFIYLNKILFSRDNLPLEITSVSPEINDYLKKEFPECKYKMCCHPNISGQRFVYSEELRKDIREKYNIKDNEILAICSTGGNGIWQNDYKIIPHLLNMGIKVINLSKLDYGLKNCITTTVPFQEMPAMLSAGDIAVLWREDTPTNTCASPSKFSEFATMGLYVIHNGTVRVSTDYIRQYNAGLIIKDVCDLHKIEINKKEVLENRLTRSLSGIQNFGIDSLGKSYLARYRQMLENYVK